MNYASNPFASWAGGNWFNKWLSDDNNKTCRRLVNRCIHENIKTKLS